MRTEDDVRAALAELEAGAPTIESVLPSTRRTRTPHKPWLLPAAAALVVLLIVAGLSIATLANRSPSTTTPTTAVPSSLADVGWIGSATSSSGTPAAVPTGIVMRTNGNFQVGLDVCTSLLGTARFEARVAEFNSRVAPHSCPYEPSGRARDLVGEELIESILTGTVTWVLHDDQLTITKDGVGTIIYTRGAVDPPSPDGEA